MYLRLWVLVIVFVVHFSYISNGLVWLDRGDIRDGRAIVPIGDLKKAFFQPFGETGFYRPMVTIVHSLDAAVFGKYAPGFHITSIGLHLVATVVVMKLMKMLFDLKEKEALLAGLIFGIHPVSFFPVGVPAVRQEILLVIVVGWAVICYVKYLTNPSWILGFWLTVSTMLAFFSKETAVFAIPALVMYCEMVLRRSGREISKAMGLVGVCLVIYLFFRTQALPEVWRYRGPELTLGQRVNLSLSLVGRNSKHLISPFQNYISDTIELEPISRTDPLLGVFILVVGGAVFVFRSDARKFMVFLVILMLPGMNLVSVPRVGSPHYAYLAAVAVGVAGVHAIRKFGNMGWIVVGLWIMIAGLSTYKAGYKFRNDLTLFEAEVKRDPLYREGNYYLGNYYFFDKKDYPQAQRYYLLAAKRTPDVLSYVDEVSLAINLAGTYVHQGRLDLAEKLLLEIQPQATGSNQQLVVYNLDLITQLKRTQQ